MKYDWQSQTKAQELGSEAGLNRLPFRQQSDRSAFTCVAQRNL